MDYKNYELVIEPAAISVNIQPKSKSSEIDERILQTNKTIIRHNLITVSLLGFDKENMFGEVFFDFDVYGQNCTLDKKLIPQETIDFGMIKKSIVVDVSSIFLPFLTSQFKDHIIVYNNGKMVFIANYYENQTKINEKFKNFCIETKLINNEKSFVKMENNLSTDKVDIYIPIHQLLDQKIKSNSDANKYNV